MWREHGVGLEAPGNELDGDKMFSIELLTLTKYDDTVKFGDLDPANLSQRLTIKADDGDDTVEFKKDTQIVVTNGTVGDGSAPGFSYWSALWNLGWVKTIIKAGDTVKKLTEEDKKADDAIKAAIDSSTAYEEKRKGIDFKDVETFILTDKDDMFFVDLADDESLKEVVGGSGGDILFARGVGTDTIVTLSGGKDNDWIVTLGGYGAVLIGGEGQDWLFSTTTYSEVYGDTPDGVGADGKTLATKEVVDKTGEEPTFTNRGQANADDFWFWPGTFIMDAGREDALKMFGIPLSGGTNLPVFGGDMYSLLACISQYAGSSIAMDWFLPWVFYARTESNQLIVFDRISHALDIGPDDMKGMMVVEDYHFGALRDAHWNLREYGELGMTWRLWGGDGEDVDFSLWTLVWGHVMVYAQALWGLVKLLDIIKRDDPLVLDLDGDGIETISQSQSGVYFDFNADFFAEQTGWLAGDDGFLVVDRSGNGRIDDVTEMFGAPGVSGYAMLAGYDTNHDGVIDARDSGFAEIKIWRDLDGDAVTDAGELFTLEEAGIASLQASGTELTSTTPQGTRLLAHGTYTRLDGTTGNAFEAVFETNATDTIFRGERGLAAWLVDASVPDTKGFGRMVDLEVAISNDFEIAALATAVANSMTTVDLADLRAKATPLYGPWAQTQEATRELTPVLLQRDAAGTALQAAA